MLNTNQSQKRNSWKYSLVIPALIGFVFLFQIKTIAQEKESDIEVARSLQHREEIRLVIDKNSSEDDLKREAKRLKEEHGVTLKCSKIKRNDKGEITGIKVEFKDKNGNKGVSQVDGKEPIAPIHFYKNNEAIGFGRPKNVKVFANVPNVHMIPGDALDALDSLPTMEAFNFDFDFEMPEAPPMPEDAEAPEAFSWSNNGNSKVIIKKSGDKKPMVIVNGKVLSDDAEIEKALNDAGAKGQYSIVVDSDENGGASKVTINGKDVAKFRADAMANAKVQIKKMKPQIEEQIRIANGDWKRVKEEMEKVKPQIALAKRDMEAARPDMEKAKAEMEQAKAEMIKAKEEMQKAKAELDRAREELKRTK